MELRRLARTGTDVTVLDLRPETPGALPQAAPGRRCRDSSRSCCRRDIRKKARRSGRRDEFVGRRSCSQWHGAASGLRCPADVRWMEPNSSPVLAISGQARLRSVDRCLYPEYGCAKTAFCRQLQRHVRSSAMPRSCGKREWKPPPTAGLPRRQEPIPSRMRKNWARLAISGLSRQQN